MVFLGSFLAFGYNGQPPVIVILVTWMEIPDNLSSIREMVAKNLFPKGLGNEPEGYK
jgi:hypothetical protein